MKKNALLFVIVLAFIFQAKAQTTLVIVNNTGIDVYSIFASSVNQSEWGRDLLKTNILEPGERLTITFPVGYDCSVDIKASADADDEDFILFEGVDICEVSGITLLGNGKFRTW